MSEIEYTTKTQRIVEILVTNSDIEQKEVNKLARRLDYIGKGKPDKMLAFLTGTFIEDVYTSEANIIGGFGEMAMYYTGGNKEVATEIVLASPVGETYDREDVEKHIVREWKKMGSDTFDNMIGSIPVK